MSQSTFSMEKVRCNPIDENTIGRRRDTTHDLVDEGMRETNKSEDEVQIRPTNPIKGFGEVDLENNGFFCSVS